MTDEKIIKALECCANSKCIGCPFNDGFKDCAECTTELAKNALFLISRQIGEIEDLKQDVSNLEETNGYLFAEFERRYGDESRIDEHTPEMVRADSIGRKDH